MFTAILFALLFVAPVTNGDEHISYDRPATVAVPDTTGIVVVRYDTGETYHVEHLPVRPAAIARLP